MLIVLTSPDALLINGAINQKLVDVLKQAREKGYPTGLVSNHKKPDWFDATFAGTQVQFVREYGRQNGDFVKANAETFSLKPFDVLVLATKADDVQMGKNSGAVLVAGGWSSDKQVAALGVQVATPDDLSKVIELSAEWPGKWWFAGDAAFYNVRALSDLSSKKYGLTHTQQAFAHRLTATVKNGGVKLNALLAVTARSLLMDGFGERENLLWGVYPSSSSANDDSEVLSDFCHRLRTTVSRVQMAKRGVPLFIRHTASSKRSAGGGGDRTNPTEQILTLHLNPHYKKSDRLVGKNVVVLDDCTTYGVSFGVAAAFLRAAGAASVTGIALGKFGSQLRDYEIEISGDPFMPVKNGDFKILKSESMAGVSNSEAQSSLQNLID
ncbi:hypothetical protein [Herbaspirillum rubrisubalbicans]|uniref:hypothetical protein n=1 Tax=Herbaspirillum rubrisubalbicans TaxID=80842 RepID=UPI000DD340EB|nr:hypothetical protein [Herbaspirillum rubrisubalbicans]